ncbi:MAG TPA: pantoate--beta-alanine ligase [Gemmatimonadaceae bacterium]|nr:pantoate--beta-alanine ligase [Gemmatimonadaceae bacterium]
MQTVHRIAELRPLVRDWRRSGARIALVPTMGALHEGHLHLVDAARAAADVVVMSIFVNPLQFGPSEDFERYPRDLEGDLRKAETRGVDAVFAPPAEEMYAHARTVIVAPVALADRWEGASRPGHFAGVLTVVAKLFNIVQPDVAVFGQKDIQQAALIRAMVRDLDIPLTVLIEPTVRDTDGLALSSRNRYLSPEERRQAQLLPRALHEMADAYAGGEVRALALVERGRAILATAPLVRVEYLAAVDPDRLEPVTFVEEGTILAVAARVGATRLIDNVIVGAS